METDNADVNEQPSEAVGSETQSASEFIVPAEYQDRVWAKGIKSEADLWKSMENAQSLIGRKTINIPDFNTAKEEEIANFYTHTRPKQATDYEISGEFSDEERASLQDVFYKNGLNKVQAKNILGFFQENINNDVASDYGEEGMKAEFEKRFGQEWEKEIVPVKDALNAVLTKEQASVLNDLPNSAIGALFSLTKSIMTKYGANETDTATGSDRAIKPKMPYEEFYQKMKEADGLPDGAQIKKELMKRYYGE